MNIIDNTIAIIKEPKKKATTKINGKNNAKSILYLKLINGLLKILICDVFTKINKEINSKTYKTIFCQKVISII